jgi:hypothetical protein
MFKFHVGQATMLVPTKKFLMALLHQRASGNEEEKMQLFVPRKLLLTLLRQRPSGNEAGAIRLGHHLQIVTHTLEKQQGKMGGYETRWS